MEKEKNQKKLLKLWARAGVDLFITPEEAETLLSCADFDAADRTMETILREGRFAFDGETYIPGSCIEDFNKAQGTSYAAEDLDYNVGKIGLDAVLKKG